MGRGTLCLWNDFLGPLVVTSSPEAMSVSDGRLPLIGIRSTDVPVLMAGSWLATLPMMVTCFVLHRRLIEGIAFTGMKS